MRIYDSSCRGSDIAVLSTAYSVSRLLLSSLSNLYISVLSQLPHLEYLNLYGSEFSGDLQSFTRLRTLVLNGTTVSSIEFVPELPLLECLELRDTSNLIDLTPLGRLPEGHRLSSLDLSDKQVLNLASSLTSGSLPLTLKQLSMARCMLRLQGLCEICAACSRLEVLRLYRTLIEQDINELLSCLPVSLRELQFPLWLRVDLARLSRCCHLTTLEVTLWDVSPVQVVTGLRCLKQLRHLVVSGGRIHDILEAVPSLQSLKCEESVDWDSRTSFETGLTSDVTNAVDVRPHLALRSLCCWSIPWYPLVSRLMPQITELKLEDMVPPAHEVLMWPALRSLYINTRAKLAQGFVATLLMNLPRLEVFSVRCGVDRDQPTQVHINPLRKISTLVLHNAPVITLAALFEFTSLRVV